MSRWIDADRLKMVIEKNFGHGTVEPIYQLIDAAPTIEPKQGEWIPKEMWTEGVGMGEQYGRYYECSECHREYRGDMESCHNFCPNCGADMRKGSTR